MQSKRHMVSSMEEAGGGSFIRSFAGRQHKAFLAAVRLSVIPLHCYPLSHVLDSLKDTAAVDDGLQKTYLCGNIFFQ